MEVGALDKPSQLEPRAGPGAGGDTLAAWAERTGRHRAGQPGRVGLRFAFYGRVSTEDYQDPVPVKIIFLKPEPKQ